MSDGELAALMGRYEEVLSAMLPMLEQKARRAENTPQRSPRAGLVR